MKKYPTSEDFCVFPFKDNNEGQMVLDPVRYMIRAGRLADTNRVFLQIHGIDASTNKGTILQSIMTFGVETATEIYKQLKPLIEEES